MDIVLPPVEVEVVVAEISHIEPAPRLTRKARLCAVLLDVGKGVGEEVLHILNAEDGIVAGEDDGLIVVEGLSVVFLLRGVLRVYDVGIYDLVNVDDLIRQSLLQVLGVDDLAVLKGIGILRSD